LPEVANKLLKVLNKNKTEEEAFEAFMNSWNISNKK
jgi:hypothetical protein